MHDCVHIVNDGSCCVTDTAFSVCSKPCNLSQEDQPCPEQGRARSIVGAASNGALTCRDPRCCKQPGLRLKCQHCKAVAGWMQMIKHAIDTHAEAGDPSEELEKLTALAAACEGLKLNAEISQTHPHISAAARSHLPISQSRIDPDSQHPVMRQRSQHSYGMHTEGNYT